LLQNHRFRFRKAAVDFSFKGTLGWLERTAEIGEVFFHLFSVLGEDAECIYSFFEVSKDKK
jgi:hypothetical protein